MASRKPQKRTIIVALWLAGSAGRKQLTGILRYVNNGRPWSVQLITDPKDFTNDVLAKAEANKVDGIIIHADARSADNLATSVIPTVLMDFPPPKLARRTRAVSVILDSDEAIGEMAARYFQELGTFASYAFIPDAANRGWSRLRERGFERALHKQQIACSIYNQSKGPLHTWLKALPRPVAVLSAFDIGAQETIDACKKAGLEVPKQVSVLGVSRRLIDRRFSAVTGTSIHRAIEDCRLAQVKKRLRTTKLSIKKISRLCGYTNEQRLKYIFKQRIGCSMSDWRNQHPPQN